MRLDIRKILVPLDEDLSREPCVSAADRITKAIEAMLKNDLKQHRCDQWDQGDRHDQA